MKIYYLTVATIPSTTAHAAYVLNLARALGLAGVTTTIGACRANIDQTDSINAELPSNVKLETFSVITRSANSRIISLFFHVLFSNIKFDPDCLVITHNPLIAVALSLKKTHFIYDFHGVSGRGRMINYALHSAYLKGCLYNSKQMAVKLREKFFELSCPQMVLGCGIWASEFADMKSPNDAKKEKLIPENSIVIGYVGSMGEHRGVDLLLNAASELKNSSKNYFWLFVGGRPEQITEWEQLAQSLDLNEQHVRFVGHQPQSSLKDWYACTNILCAPYSLKLSTAQVMDPMKLYEYIAAKKNIIVSDIHTTRDALENCKNVWFVEPDSTSSLVSAVLSASEQILNQSNKSQENDFLKGKTWEDKVYMFIEWVERYSIN